jgi:Cdc6-like AAA superfamily ATPase
MTTSEHFGRLSFAIGSVFTPRTPINERDLFAGRVGQLAAIIEAVSQRGCHCVLFGERGVGKTSLANILGIALPDFADEAVVTHINCVASDDYASIWKKALGDISTSTTRQAMGFEPKAPVSTHGTLADLLPEIPQPHDVKKILDQLNSQATAVVILDEFDRIGSTTTRTLIADTIKMLSDAGTKATLLIVGVADSVDQLIKEHQSVERAVVQIPMPRMSSDEIRQIVEKGFGRLGCKIRPDALKAVVRLSQGLPHIAHLLSLHAGRNAFRSSSEIISHEHVSAGTLDALDEWQQSIRAAYTQATRSNQPGTIYKEVLLACALSDKDEGSFFTAASVRAPLRRITGKDHDIPNYAQHLKKFSEAGRGKVLYRVGETRRIRYRFDSPMMHAYVVVRGVADELIDDSTLDELVAEKTMTTR